MRAAVLAALFVLGGAGSAWAAGQTLGQPLPQRSPEKVYSSTCGYCHGTNIGPIIRGRSLPAVAVSAMVRSGMNAMPAFRPSEISPAELAALAQWIEKSSADPKEKGQ